MNMLHYDRTVLMGLERGGRGIGPYHGCGRGRGGSALVERRSGRRWRWSRHRVRDALISAGGSASTFANIVVVIVVGAVAIVDRWSGSDGDVMTAVLMVGRSWWILPRVRDYCSRDWSWRWWCGWRCSVLVVRNAKHVWLGRWYVHYSIVMVISVTVFCEDENNNNILY